MRLDRNHMACRREFFRAVARYGLLGLLTLVAGMAARPRAASGQSCINRGLCRGCGAFAGCGLPQALSAKRVQSGGGA